jgi:serine/threonine protein kinase
MTIHSLPLNNASSSSEKKKTSPEASPLSPSRLSPEEQLRQKKKKLKKKPPERHKKTSTPPPLSRQIAPEEVLKALYEEEGKEYPDASSVIPRLEKPTRKIFFEEQPVQAPLKDLDLTESELDGEKVLPPPLFLDATELEGNPHYAHHFSMPTDIEDDKPCADAQFRPTEAMTQAPFFESYSFENNAKKAEARLETYGLNEQEQDFKKELEEPDSDWSLYTASSETVILDQEEEYFQKELEGESSFEKKFFAPTPSETESLSSNSLKEPSNSEKQRSKKTKKTSKKKKTKKTSLSPSQSFSPSSTFLQSPVRSLEKLSQAMAVYRNRRYQKLGKVGKTSASFTFEVLDLNLKRKVLMKMLSLERLTHSDQLRRFVYEAQFTAKLTHPSIPPIYELGADSKGNLFFTTPSLSGEPLAQILKRLREPSQSATQPPSYSSFFLLLCFRKIAEVLAYAHQQGIVHGRWTPEQILISTSGELFFTQWQGASFLNKTSPFSLKTSEEELLKAVPYVSPERAQAEPLELASDIYLLGVLFYELLTPHSFLGEKTAEAYLQQLQEEQEEPLYPSKEESIPQNPLVHTLLKNCLSFSPDQRYPTIQKLLSDLDHYLESLTPKHPSEELFSIRTSPQRISPSSSSSSSSSSPLPSSTSSFRFLGLLFLALVFLGGAVFSGFLYFQSNRELQLQTQRLEKSKNEYQSLKLKEEQSLQEGMKWERRNTAYQKWIEACQLIQQKEKPAFILQALEQALQHDKTFYLAVLERALFYQNRFQLDLADLDFTQAEQIYEQEFKHPNFKIKLYRAWLYLYDLQKIQKAVTLFREMVKHSDPLPAEFEPYRGMAEAYLRLFEDDFESAFAWALRLYRESPHLWESSFVYANIASIGTSRAHQRYPLNALLSSKICEKGQKHFQKLGNVWYEAPLKCWQDLVQQNPFALRYSFLKACLYEAIAVFQEDQGKTKERQFFLQKAESDYAQLVEQGYLSAYLAQIRLLMTQQQLQKAHPLIQQFQEKFPLEEQRLLAVQQQISSLPDLRKQAHVDSPLRVGDFLEISVNLPEETVISYFWTNASDDPIGRTLYALVTEQKLVLEIPRQLLESAKLWIFVDIKPELQSEQISAFLQKNYQWDEFEQAKQRYYQTFIVPFH